MAISQDRMISMIEELEQYKLHTEKLIKELKDSVKFEGQGLLSREEAWAGISITIANYQPPQLKRFFIEQDHFRKKASYNEKKKRYMQGQKLTAQGQAQEGAWLKPQAESKPFALPQASLQASPQTSPYSRETTLQMQQDIERALAPPPVPKQPTPPRRQGDVTPDLSEYQVEPPDFKKGIF